MRLERDNIPLDKEFPFQISEVELTPENSRPGSYHWHSYFEITCVLGGKGNYFVNGQEYTMEEDDIIIFNNVEPHGWKLIGAPSVSRSIAMTQTTTPCIFTGIRGRKAEYF